MADSMLLAGITKMPVFEFENAAFTPAPALKDATVAIVTTAGLSAPGGDGWKAADPGYRAFDRGDRSMRVGHLSPNFDHVGAIVDLNVVYPIDRLEELAAEGIIGGVAPRHFSFMGAQPDHTMETIRLDTAPAVGKMLREDGVDVVLLTPV